MAENNIKCFSSDKQRVTSKKSRQRHRVLGGRPPLPAGNNLYYGEPSFRGGPNTCIQGNVSGSTFSAYGRPAVRIPCRYEALRCDKNKDCARAKNAYEKYVRMRTKFVPYLVRNSLHFCSIFLGEIMV